MTPAEEKQLRAEAACWRMTKFVWTRHDRICLFRSSSLMPFTAGAYSFSGTPQDKDSEGPTPEKTIEALFRAATTSTTPAVTKKLSTLPGKKPIKKLGARR